MSIETVQNIIDFLKIKLKSNDCKIMKNFLNKFKKFGMLEILVFFQQFM